MSDIDKMIASALSAPPPPLSPMQAKMGFDAPPKPKVSELDKMIQSALSGGGRGGNKVTPAEVQKKTAEAKTAALTEGGTRGLSANADPAAAARAKQGNFAPVEGEKPINKEIPSGSRAIKQAAGVVQAYSAAKEMGGAVKGMAHTARNLLEYSPPGMAVRSFNETARLVSGKPTVLDKASDKVDEFLEPKKGEKAGYGVEQFLELMVPEAAIADVAKVPEVATLVKTLASKLPAKIAGAPALAAKAADAGIKLAAATLAQTKDPKQAAEAFAVGSGTFAVGLSGLYGADKLRGKVGKFFAERARETYAKIIRALGSRVQFDVANKLLGGGEKDLVGRKFIGTSVGNMAEKAEEKAHEIGKQIDEAYEKLGPKAKLSIKPLYDDVYAFLGKKLGTNGQPVSEEAVPYINMAMRKLKAISRYTGKEFEAVNPRDLRKVRQLLDKKLYKLNPGKISVESPQHANLLMQGELNKVVADSIRDILNSDPNIGKLNDAFSFWKKTAEVLRARATKEASQIQWGSRMLGHGKSITGSIVGGIFGGGKAGEEGGDWKSVISGAGEGAAIGAIAGTTLQAAFSSAAWRGVSSVVQDSIAKLLLDGKEYEAAGLAMKHVLRDESVGSIEKQKLIAAAKKFLSEKEAKAALSYFTKSEQDSIFKTVVPPKKGTLPPPAYKPQQWQIKAATEKVIGDTGVTPSTPNKFKKEAKAAYKEVSAEAEKEASATNIKLEQKKDAIYSKALGIKKSGEMTTQEASAVVAYKGTAYHGINKSLYAGEKASPEVKHLDAAIAKHALENDAILYRGVHGPYGAELKGLKVGDTFTNKGFNSSSSSLNVAKHFSHGNGAVIKIEAKAGQNAYPYGYNDFEKEYILPRGMKFRVKSVEEVDSGADDMKKFYNYQSSSGKIKILTVEVVK